jgi:glycosyltransferase involved in cell wall biosynthesis
MTAPDHIIHIIPRLIGGGPERSILAHAYESTVAGRPLRRTVLVLDPPVAPSMLIASRRLGIEVLTRFDDDVVCAMVSACHLLHVHFWNHPTLFRLLRRLRLPPTRLVVTAHVLGTSLPQMLPAEIGALADVLILTSADSLRSQGARAAPRVEILPSIIDRSRMVEPTEPLVRTPDQPVVGYLGSLAPTKLHPHIVELCTAVTHPTARFVFRGSGEDPMLLMQRFAGTHLASRVEVGGSVEDIASLLHGFDVFGYPLAPGTYATSDRVLQEAMWMGAPPVVLGGSAPASFVQHGVTGLVVDEQGYPTAIDDLLSDQDARATLGDAAREWARTTLDPTLGNTRMLQIYGDLLDGPKRDREPISGEDDPAAVGFLHSLGWPDDDAARCFAISLGLIDGDATAADRMIAASPPVLSGGEGGIVHYRNSFSDDPHLRWWSALVARHAGNRSLADDEAAAARSFGLPARAWP